MEVGLLAHKISDLCIGKPPLRSLSASANTVADALAALKRHQADSPYLSVWNCSDVVKAGDNACRCVGKICMVDVVCFLCREENLACPATALQLPVSVLLREVDGVVRHLDPHASILEAINLILEGAQNLVVPIQNKPRKKHTRKPSLNPTLHNNEEYCWIAQEDIIRYILNSISLFCPTAVQTINSLNIIETESILAVHHDKPAVSALPLILQSLIKQTSVAIVDSDNKLIGEIAPFILNCCDESVIAAITTLSAGDLMAYIDGGGPPEDLVQFVKEELQRRNMNAALELMEDDSELFSSGSSSYTSSSDDDFGSGRSGKLGIYSARISRQSEATVCCPWSSLVAVMIQALSHRVSYVWVVDDDGTLAGIVTFAGMLKVFREHSKPTGI